MYPKNAASPQRIAIGAVVQISDGAVQTSGVSVKVLPQGTTASAGGGTIAYEEGIVHYLPTQAETNYASFIVLAYKAGCIPVSVTIVTSASTVAGYAGLDWAAINAPTTTQGLSGTTIATSQVVASVSGAVGSVTGAVGSVTARVTANTDQLAGQTVTAAAGVTFPTSVASPTNITAGTITTATNVTTVNGLAANVITAASIATAAFTAAKFDAGAIDAAALATTAVDEIRDGVWAKVQTELTGDPGATPTVLQSLALPYMAIRNKRDTDSGLGTDEIHNSAGAVILTAAISDAAGVFSKAKYA